MPPLTFPQMRSVFIPSFRFRNIGLAERPLACLALRTAAAVMLASHKAAIGFGEIYTETHAEEYHLVLSKGDQRCGDLESLVQRRRHHPKGFDERLRRGRVIFGVITVDRKTDARALPLVGV